jgi:restriction endonuclease S subunit
MPPIHEQKRIVDIVSSIDDMTLQLEISLENSKNVRSSLIFELLLGKHEIPATYDKELEVA